jgi:hypothetical protein
MSAMESATVRVKPVSWMTQIMLARGAADRAAERGPVAGSYRCVRPCLAPAHPTLPLRLPPPVAAIWRRGVLIPVCPIVGHLAGRRRRAAGTFLTVLL